MVYFQYEDSHFAPRCPVRVCRCLGPAPGGLAQRALCDRRRRVPGQAPGYEGDRAPGSGLRSAAEPPRAATPPRPRSRPPHARVVIERGEVWWADLDEPAGSEPGYRRPVLIVQADAFNRSRLQTTIAIVLTSNLRLIDAPGNVLVPKQSSGLPKGSVANVSQLVTLD